jgi:DNL zinc finger
MRSFSKQAYTSGVVIIKCPDCGSRHLIADRLGWFGDSASVETILKEKGQGMCPLILAVLAVCCCLRCLLSCMACCRLTAVVCCADVRWHETGGTLELSDADAAAWSQVRSVIGTAQLRKQNLYCRITMRGNRTCTVHGTNGCVCVASAGN